MNTNIVLKNYNAHERDKNIQFFEEGHKYIILSDPNSKYTSVTTWAHSHFPHFDADKIIEAMMKGKGWKEGHKYWGLTPDQIKSQWNSNKDSVAGAGTSLHYEIECFMNNGHLSSGYNHADLYNDYLNGLNNNLTEGLKEKPIEWQYFINYVKDLPDFKPYRTEWTIYHEELKLAGSIDMIYENADGSLDIYDWKRCKEITRINNFNKFAVTRCISQFPDANFWHYSLQLNIYKAILEEKYDKKIRNLCLVKLHPENEDKNYEIIPLPNLTNEIKELFEELREKNRIK